MKNAILISIIFGLLFSAVSVLRHNHYFSQGHDLGIFTQSAWLYSQGLTPYNTLTQRLDFQDRYKPIMIVLGFLFRFWPDPRFLLVLQSFFLAFSGIFLYAISRKIGHGNLTSYILMTVYLLYPGITSFIIDDFHEISLFPLFFLGAIYFYLRKSNTTYLFLFASLIIRDYLVLFSLVFWISLLFSKNKLIKNELLLKIVTINILGLILMIITINLVGGISYGSFNSEGNSIFQTIIKYISNPINLLVSYFIPYLKLKTLVVSLGYFAFLPLFNFWLIIPILFQFAGRFLDFEHPYRWEIFYHYSGELATILSFGTILALKKINLKERKYLVILIFIISIFSVAFFHSPLLLLRKAEFWRKESWMKDNDYIISQVPKNASVAAQNNLVPHFSLRQQIYVLPIINNADYVALDLREGQDRFNFYGLSYDEMRQLQTKLIGDYELINQKGEIYLYKKIYE